MDAFNHFLPWTKKRVQTVSAETWHQLALPDQNIRQDQKVPITALMLLLWQKYNGNCRVKTFKERALLVNWYCNLAYSIWNIEQLESVLAGTAPSIMQNKKSGFNLIGYSRASLGLGEDLRRYADLFEESDIPYSIYHIGHASESTELFGNKQERYDLPYDTSLFCLNVIELRKLFDIWGESLHADFGRIIVAPPWELPQLPEEWISVLDQCDEVWAMSKFVESAYKSAPEIAHKVNYFPPVVRAPDGRQEAPAQKRPFTFLYIFDAGSFISRKNPRAAVDAFLLAFPKNGTKVRLIIKTSNVHTDTKEWLEFVALCRLDPRISLYRESFSQRKMNRLWAECDCYLSLHRSEGFGRTIAEAVARKIPVISTHWSGSTDITGTDYPLGVAFKLVELQPDEYPYWQNQRWAAPDIKDAASKMQWVVNNQNRGDLFEIIEQNYERYISKFSLSAERSYCSNER